MKMDCRQIEELMMEYLYQELDAAQTTAYRAHLSSCPQCAAQLAGYERTRQAVRLLPELDPPVGVTARLLHEAAQRRPVQAVAAGVGASGLSAAAAGKGQMGDRGWWGRVSDWLQPLFAHPGFVAATGLVLVAGVAGVLVLGRHVGFEATAKAPQAVAPAAVPEPPPAPAAAPPPTVGLSASPGTLAPESPPPPAEPAPAAGADKGRARIATHDEQVALDGYASGRGAAVEGGTRPTKKAAAKQPEKFFDQRLVPVEEAKPAAPQLGRAGGVGAEKADEREQKKEAKQAPSPASRAPAKPAPAEPPAPTRASRNEPSDDAEAAGALAPAAAPPPPAAAAESAPMAPSGAQAKDKAKVSAQENEARKLHGQARAKANTGDCAGALKLRERIYRIDPAYFDRSVKNDADLVRCSNARRKQSNESRDSKAPARANEAPATDVTK
jgi:anti-sigma factor RsiW